MYLQYYLFARLLFQDLLGCSIFQSSNQIFVFDWKFHSCSHLYDDLLPGFRGICKCGPRAQPCSDRGGAFHAAGHAYASGCCGYCAYRRDGGGCERPDFRTYQGRDSKWLDASGEHSYRLRAGTFNHCRCKHHYLDCGHRTV